MLSGSSFLALAFVLLASLCSAADKKQFSDAIAAVDANLKTPAGKQYDERIGKEFSDKYISSVKQCKQSLPAGASAGRISSCRGPGRGSAPLGDSARRVPRTIAGTTGQPARTALTNAPVWNFSRPGVSVNVPSGKNTSECPSSAWRISTW